MLPKLLTKINPYSYKLIDKGVHQINEIAVSEFLIEGKDKTLLIDAGCDIFNLKKFVKSKTNKEIMVVNTHFHFDHSNGNHKWDTVYIGEKEMPTFTTKDCYLKLVDDVSSALYKNNPKLRLLKPVFNKLLVPKKGKTKYIPLKDGEEIDLGGRKLIVKDFPGHTPGSITFLDPSRKNIFMGDACNMGFYAWTNPGLNLHDYADTARAYYKDVKSAGYKTIRGSHEPFSHKISFIKDYAEWVDKLTPEQAKKQFDLPGGQSKLCVAAKLDIKHGAFACIYFAHQCD